MDGRQGNGIIELGWRCFTFQVSCTVLNSSYATNVCSCDEQISVFDTCTSRYPCLKVYVSYVIVGSTTPRSPHPPPSSLPASGRHRKGRRQRRGTATESLEAAIVDNSATLPTGGPSDVEQLEPLAEVQDHYDHVENQLSSSDVSLIGDYVSSPVVTASPAVSQNTDGHPTTAEYPPSLIQLTGNASEPVTSYSQTNETRPVATDYPSGNLTPTVTADVSFLYVAQLYRSWDDAFLPEVP